MNEDRQSLVELLVGAGVLRFGEFTLKSGRQSPYFFNLGALHTGGAISRLGEASPAPRAELPAARWYPFGPAPASPSARHRRKGRPRRYPESR